MYTYCTCTYVRVCMHVCVGIYIKAPNPRTGGLISTWALSLWVKGRENWQKHQSHWQCQTLLGSMLDFGCQHHTSGTAIVFLWVPSLAPWRMLYILACKPLYMYTGVPKVYKILNLVAISPRYYWPVLNSTAGCIGNKDKNWLLSLGTSSQSERYSSKWLIWLVCREPLV